MVIASWCFHTHKRQSESIVAGVVNWQAGFGFVGRFFKPAGVGDAGSDEP
jgi:hypothetical protein